MADTAVMTNKPAYLGLLNAISLAESEAGVYLEAWANATTDEELAKVLRLVALRESHHGDAFCRRLLELGYPLRQKVDPGSPARLAKYANPKIPDCEKVPPESSEDSGVRDAFRDIEIGVKEGRFDAMTANMLTWYIAEERDSGRRLKAAYDRVRAQSDGQTHGESTALLDAGPSADAQAIMACMGEGFARLEKSLEKLAKALK
jgi:hypothetical protein